LSDLGTNSQLSLPVRPLTTGRLLPHIGHKHLQRDNTALGTKPTNSGSSCSSAVAGTRKTGHIIRTQIDSHSQDLRKKEPLDGFMKIGDQKLTQTKDTALGIKTDFEESGCLLNPNKLHPFLGSKLTPTPPSRKPNIKQPNGFGSEREVAKNLDNQPASSPKPVATENNKVIPSSNFKPIISVRNLELNHSGKNILENSRNFSPSPVAKELQDCAIHILRPLHPTPINY